MLNRIVIIVGLIAAFHVAAGRSSAAAPPFRPPAVPLVTSDPYLSIWSEADHLNDKTTQHWTHQPNALVSLIRIDGHAYRLMGDDPQNLPPFPQQSVKVLPTRSIYQFDDGHVHVTLSFMSAALPHDLDVLTRPLSYLTWEVHSMDGATHSISIYDSTSAQLAVNTRQQQVRWSRQTMGDLTALRVGTEDQTLLTPAGDNTRIDWGYAYAAAPAAQSKAAIGGDAALLSAFVQSGKLPSADDTRMPRAASDDQPVLAFTFDLGNVGDEPISRHLMVAYDEIWSIRYFGQKLRPYWRRNGATPSDLLQAADRDYPSLCQRCQKFDDQLMADLNTVGGPRYAQIAALSYRQCLAACGIAADANKQPLLFTKENTSNGDIATVDVIFPMDPVFILLSPSLAKASLVPILSYAKSDHWHFPNAPHDLGTYPNAAGRDNGGEGMPVEESGNMLILCDAIAKDDGNADFIKPWWSNLTQWAQYLQNYGLDPQDQLCTDDFMGHLAHNANLSIKAILGLAAYGDLCRMRGDTATADQYTALAKTDAQHWMRVAEENDHSKLAFDKPDTWSQKYNLVWDKILGLNVFPPQVAQNEIAYYQKQMRKYGVPLDSRTQLTKTDWSIWSATMASSRAQFESLIAPIYDYLDQTTARDPVADSYVTTNVHSSGMHARPVVGGVFIRMLSDQAIWKKWASGDHEHVGPWAPLPPRPRMQPVVPTSQTHAIVWRYTTTQPPADWTSPRFDDSQWQQGPAAFGHDVAPGVTERTPWNTGDIWIRRAFTLPDHVDPSTLRFLCYHDEDVEIYINGTPAAGDTGYNSGYEPLEIRAAAQAQLKSGSPITLAAHCHQTIGGQGIDLGIVSVRQPPESASP